MYLHEVERKFLGQRFGAKGTPGARVGNLFE